MIVITISLCCLWYVLCMNFLFATFFSELLHFPTHIFFIIKCNCIFPRSQALNAHKLCVYVCVQICILFSYCTHDYYFFNLNFLYNTLYANYLLNYYLSKKFKAVLFLQNILGKKKLFFNFKYVEKTYAKQLQFDYIVTSCFLLVLIYFIF